MKKLIQKSNVNNIILHGATNFGSSNYGDYIYGEIVYDYIREKGKNVFFHDSSDFFKKYLESYNDNKIINKKDSDLIVYIPGGYFGEGHNAPFKENLVQFIRFMPLGIWASYKKIPMIVMGIGAGPNKSKFMNWGIRKICNGSKFVTVRDKESYESLKKLAPKANIIESSDLIITKDLKIDDSTEQIKIVKEIKKKNKILLVHYNHSKEALIKFSRAVKAFIDKNNEYKVVVVSDSLLEFEKDYFNEFERECEINCYHFIYDDPAEMTALLKLSDVILTCKLHVGVIAASFKKSVIAIACHPEKTTRFYSQIGEAGRCVSLFEVEYQKIFEILDKYHEKNIHLDYSIINKANITWDLLDSVLGEKFDE